MQLRIPIPFVELSVRFQLAASIVDDNNHDVNNFQNIVIKNENDELKNLKENFQGTSETSVKSIQTS